MANTLPTLWPFGIDNSAMKGRKYAKGVFGGSRLDQRFSRTRYLKNRQKGETYRQYCRRVA